MSGTAETVPELCSYRGCALPRGHQAACEAELMHGKRRRIPSCLRETSPGSRSNATHSYRRSQSPDDHCGLCSKQSKRQSAAANSHRNCTSIVVPVPSKQVAFADSEVSCTAKLLRCKPAAVQGAEVDHESLHQNRVTVWYINRRRREAWHGHVTHVCPQRGILVCFQRLPHTAKSNCEEAWVCPREDEWNWGHSDLRCPDSISDGQLRNVLDSMEARIATLNQSDGAKAWPKVFRSCIHRLEVIQLGVTSAEWLNTASCSALDGFDMLHRCGITGLVETAIRLLSHVPPHNWTRHAYLPARGAWSLKLESCNTPEELLEILRAALEEVVRWPATVAATLAKRKEDDEEEEGEWMIHTCFACGERSEQGEDSRDHPYIRELLLCVACFQRFSVVSWDCDSDLLGFRCYACGFEGSEPHGCRGCSASLCERCIWLLDGPSALAAARKRRFSKGTECPSCLTAIDRRAPLGLEVRVVCDGCGLEWHPRCHFPQLDTIPGGSQRWLCVNCIVVGTPSVASWSMLSCHLCINGKGARRSTTLRRESVIARRFDHAAAMRQLNSNVDVANQEHRRKGRMSLSDGQVAQIAVRAAARGGLHVVSYCDGKGTLLGILLRAGIRVRRYISIEQDHDAQRVCRCNYSGHGHECLAADALHFIDDAWKVTIADLASLDALPVDLLMGATPCNDLSGCNATAEGVCGRGSALIHGFARLHNQLRRTCAQGLYPAVLFENVVPSCESAKDDVRRVLRGLCVLESEAAVFHAARRPRWLISNMRFCPVPLNTPNVLLQSILNEGAVALSEKAGCIITARISGVGESIASAQAHKNRNRGRELVLCAPRTPEVRGLLLSEMCRALGQPTSEVDASGKGEIAKIALIGRSLAAGQILHALQTLIQRCLEAQRIHSAVVEEGEGGAGAK